MEERHIPLFERLCKELDVIVVTGQQKSIIEFQLPETAHGSYVLLSQQGNHAEDKSGNLLWHESISREQERVVLGVIELFKRDLNLQVKNDDDLVEHRGSQISYSAIGHNEDREKKRAFDPDSSKRLGLLARHAAEVARLRTIGIDVVPAGTTTFDFFLLGKHKGYNVARLIEREGWKKDECLYIGDALFPGGNDESVVGVIPTHAVKDPDETFKFISSTLLY